MTGPRGAVLRRPGADWEIHELTVAPPKAGEVLVRMAYAGLCHSDEHMRFSTTTELPVVGGHEGSGVVAETGPGVTALAPGDHVALTFVAVCGHCRWCATDRANLCEGAGSVSSGTMADGTYRFHGAAPPLAGQPLGSYCRLGTFAEYAVVSQDSCVKVDPDLPLAAAALVSCGVLTGWGAAVRTAGIQPGDTVIVAGAGGVGLSAVQGARYAGATAIIAVDPVPAKRELAGRLGATHAAAGLAEAAGLAAAANPVPGGADTTIVCAGDVTAAMVTGAFAATGKGGAVVLAGLSRDPDELTIHLPGSVLARTERRVLGCYFGSCNPVRDIPLVLSLYQRGELQLDELISARYRLDDITAGYADLAAGRNARGLIAFMG